MSRVWIEPHELKLVREIIDRCLPPGTSTFVFGSRATGQRLKPWSDLDLAFEWLRPLPIEVMGCLEDEFDDALLDWKVDLIDLHTVSPQFRRIVDGHKVPLPQLDGD